MPETKLTRRNFCKDYFNEVPRTGGQKPVVECNLCEEGSKKRILVPRGLSTDYRSAEKHLVKHDKKYGVRGHFREYSSKRPRVKTKIIETKETHRR